MRPINIRRRLFKRQVETDRDQSKGIMERFGAIPHGSQRILRNTNGRLDHTRSQGRAEKDHELVE
jgi:hypothetical protein